MRYSSLPRKYHRAEYVLGAYGLPRDKTHVSLQAENPKSYCLLSLIFPEPKRAPKHPQVHPHAPLSFRLYQGYRPLPVQKIVLRAIVLSRDCLLKDAQTHVAVRSLKSQNASRFLRHHF